VAVPTYFLAVLLWGPIALVLGLALLSGIIQLMNERTQSVFAGKEQPQTRSEPGSFADRIDAILSGKEEPQEKPRN
jgi:hypothetical protein